MTWTDWPTSSVITLVTSWSVSDYCGEERGVVLGPWGFVTEGNLGYFKMHTKKVTSFLVSFILNIFWLISLVSFCHWWARPLPVSAIIPSFTSCWLILFRKGGELLFTLYICILFQNKVFLRLSSVNMYLMCISDKTYRTPSHSVIAFWSVEVGMSVYFLPCIKFVDICLTEGEGLFICTINMFWVPSLWHTL